MADRDRPGPPDAAVIRLEDVVKVYGRGDNAVTAVAGVSPTVDRGDFIAIAGPSGSGKSTLMHIIGCLDVPTSGRYLLSGQDVAAMDEEELAAVRNARIGFVFQQFHLLTTLPAWRNVELPLLYRRGDGDRHAAAMQAIEAVGLTSRAHHRPNQMSGGQQQRVAIARALVTNPDIVLADEPTGNLDTASSREIMDLLCRLNADGRTVVLITHEPEVAAVASRRVMIRDGALTEAAAA